jgi:glycosyltransferase involved in cell wall biosynthesis
MNDRVLLINQFFWPDVAATAQLLADLAEDLAADGWQVTALAGRGRYAGGESEPLPRREIWGDVRIRRVWCSDLGRGSALRRVTDYATFLVTAGWFVLFGRWWWRDRHRDGRSASAARSFGPSGLRMTEGFDGIASAPAGPRNDSNARKVRRVVVCLSTPPLVAVLGLLARLRGAGFVYKVEDLYPDVAVALGTFERRSPAVRCFGRVSRALLSRADTVVAVDEAMGRTLQAGGARRVAVIPNWADGEALRPDREAGEGFRAVYGLGDRFVVLYSGNLGLAHRFDAVIAAARAIATVRPDVLFLFVGGGPRLAEVQRLAAGLANVRFLPYQPREALGALYNAAEVHLVTMRDEVAGLLVPSKYAAALAAARPVLLVGGTETGIAREIEDEGLGWVCPHDPGVVVAALKEALQVRGLLEEQGRRARAVFEGRYERGGATARWSRVLRDVAAASAG